MVSVRGTICQLYMQSSVGLWLAVYGGVDGCVSLQIKCLWVCQQLMTLILLAAR